MPPRKQYTFRRWTLTWFPPSELDVALMDLGSTFEPLGPERYEDFKHQAYLLTSPSFNFDTSGIITYVYQVERCPVTGRLHIQGYISFKDAITRTAVGKRINMPGVHLEPAQSDAQTNFKYCTKKDTRFVGPWASGDFSGSGHRSDLDGLYAMAEQYATGKEMLQQFGGHGMKNIYLYQKTVRVLIEDDEVDKRILAKRDEYVKKCKDAKATLDPHSLKDEDDDDANRRDDSDDESEPTPSEFSSDSESSDDEDDNAAKFF